MPDRRSAPPTGWTVLIPLKPPATGKSRLAVPDRDRPPLAQAIALDTLAAACACPRVEEVIVISSDPSWDLPRGARLVLEPRTTTIDAAIALGLATVSEHAPRAVLLGDLSGLDPADLSEALDAAGGLDRGLVRDVEGTGTTLLTSRSGVRLTTAFGTDSALHHQHLGHADLPIRTASTLRRDVDTVDHLSWRIGPRTTMFVRAAGLPLLQVTAGR
ncbi:2-phospho-L-lactate guanylyltransferase [Microbacterium sp. A93]|uniref:2-phospho-L-lactate guanylyltransferase n=1 Tax=Microbacterium sp. A93 TaxID=3450716 RepID=UPI003F4228E4